MMTHSYNLSLGEVEIEEFLELFEQISFSLICEPSVPVRGLASKKV